MIIGIYFGTFLIALGIMASLLILHRRISTNFVFLSILVTASSFGRFLISVSTTMELANLGNLFLHTGACFCPLLLIRILADYCEIRLPKYFLPLLFALACVVFCLPMPLPGMHLFYTRLSLNTSGSFSYLEKEFGPLHFLYPSMLLLYLGVCIFILILGMKKRVRAYLSTVIITVLVSAAVLGFYLMDRLYPNQISLSTHGYFIATIALLWHMEKSNMFDLSSNISSSLEAMNEIGYIEFDRDYRCMGYNPRAKQIFPEIGSWTLGKKVPESGSFFYREVIQWIYERKKGEKKSVQLEDRCYELNIRDIPYRHRACVGYMLALIDRTSEANYLSTMENYNADLKKEVEKKTERISHIKDMMVVGMASMVESRDDTTGDHIKRTYAVTQVFTDYLRPYAKQLGVTQEFLDMVTRAAPMHDLGKIAIDDAVLKKQGLFTPEDFELMKVHPQEGAKIVHSILTGVEDPEFVTIAENVAHYHHEKWDGSGYPEGLKGEQIPLEARIMALPDVFDALTSKRPYKEALPYDVVFPMIEQSLGSHFDPMLGRLFINCRPKLEEMYRNWYKEDRDKQQLCLTHSHSSDLSRA